jgi:hypothetical protein
VPDISTTGNVHSGKPRITRPCACTVFTLWYDDGGLAVCGCGHPRDEHGPTERCGGMVYVEGPQYEPPPLIPPYYFNMAPVHACHKMPTRHCPAVYQDVCGARPCARFESDSPAPWVPELRRHVNRGI